METIVAIIVFSIASLITYSVYRKAQISRREKRIDSFQFPDSIQARLVEKYPHLDEKDTAQVINGLRDYFHVCNIAGNRMVSMPSQVVDVAWHEFILFTRKYEHFCSRALGRFLHHTPAEAMESPTVAQKGIKTAWRIACLREKIPPKAATRLPLLFAIDAALAIPDGFNYNLDCTKTNSGYCAGHIGCGSCAGGCAGDSSGCGGGCGGD